jgi:hypothetical protein
MRKNTFVMFQDLLILCLEFQDLKAPISLYEQWASISYLTSLLSPLFSVFGCFRYLGSEYFRNG